MFSKKSTQAILTVLLCLSVALLIVVGISLFVIDKFADEDRNYKLSGEMHKLAKELKEYKNENGNYPESILEIRDSDKLCVVYFYKKCQKVHYKLSEDNQDFKMAMYSFTWPILYYHPEISMTTEELSKLSKEEQELRMKKYGTICFFCISYPQGRKDLQGDDTSTPIYGETAPFFFKS